MATKLCTKLLSSIEEVPYCFSKSSVKFQGNAGQTIAKFDPNWVFPDWNSSLKFTEGYEMMHTDWSCIKEVPYRISRLSVKFQGHTGPKIAYFHPSWAFLDSNSTDRFAITTHKAWRKDVLCFFLFYRRFESNLCNITRPVAIIKSLTLPCISSWNISNAPLDPGGHIHCNE